VDIDFLKLLEAEIEPRDCSFSIDLENSMDFIYEDHTSRSLFGGAVQAST
jgi:hypothetical protein